MRAHRAARSALTPRRPFSMSHRWERETPKRFARSSSVCSSHSRMDRNKAPNVSGPPRTFSRYFTAALFFSLTILLSSVLVLVDFLDRRELDRTLAHDVERAICAVESYGTLAFALALEGLVVESRNLAYLFEADRLDRLNPRLELVEHLRWHGSQILLCALREHDDLDHGGECTLLRGTRQGGRPGAGWNSALQNRSRRVDYHVRRTWRWV